MASVRRLADLTRLRYSVRRYDLLPGARDDLLHLADYASEYSDQARDVLTDALVDCFEALGDFPEMGRNREDLKPNLRSFPLQRLRVTVYYLTSDAKPNRVLIARLLRHRRDVQPRDFR